MVLIRWKLKQWWFDLLTHICVTQRRSVNIRWWYASGMYLAWGQYLWFHVNLYIDGMVLAPFGDSNCWAPNCVLNKLIMNRLEQPKNATNRFLGGPKTNRAPPRPEIHSPRLETFMCWILWGNVDVCILIKYRLWNGTHSQNCWCLGDTELEHEQT